MPANAKQIIRDANEQKPNIQENIVDQFQAILDKLRSGESLTKEDREILSKMSTDDKNMASGKDEGMNMNLTEPDKEYKPDNEPKQVEAQPLEAPGEHPEALPDSPITAGVAQSGISALYSKLPDGMTRAEKLGLIKQLKTNVNLLSGYHNDQEHIIPALQVIGKLAECKHNGMSYKDAMNKIVNRDKSVREMFEALKGDDRKTLINKLHETYKSEEFSKANREMAAITSTMRREANAAANALEKFKNAVIDDEIGLRENKSVDPKRVLYEGNGTQFNKMVSTGTERGARTRNVLNNLKILENNPEVYNAINEAASKGEMSIDNWSKYLEEHPEAEFWINSTPDSIDKNILLLSRKDKDNPNWQEVPLLQSDDVADFFKFIANNNLSNKVHVEHSNPQSKTTDAIDDVNRNKKWIDRYKQALTTGDTRYVYQDPKRDKLVDRDENGFVTETDRDKKDRSGFKWSDNYFKHVAAILNNSSPEELMEFFSNNMSADNPIKYQLDTIKNDLGDDSLTKANNLVKDIINLMYGLRGVDPNTDTGINIDSGLIDASAAQSLSNKIAKLKKLNPDMNISDILKSGDIGDVLGRIHPSFSDKRLPIINAWMKYNKYRKALEDGNTATSLFRDFLNENIPILKTAIETGNFENTGLTDKDQAQSILDELTKARNVFSTQKERDALVNQQIGGRSLDDLKSLADQDPEAFEAAQNKYTDAVDEYLAAKEANADFDVLNMLRTELEKARSTVDYLKYTKIDLDAEAKRTGRSYEEVKNDYLHPDWDETDFDTQLNKRLAELEINDNIRNELGDKDKNGYMLSLLDKFAGLSPKYAEAADSIRNLKKAMTLSQLLKDTSGKTIMLETGMTPEESSALASSEEAFKTDQSDKRRNTTFVGHKSASGASHADELSEQEKDDLKAVGHVMSQAKSKPENGPGDAAVAALQSELHNADMTGDTAAKKAIYDRIDKENEASAHPYTKHKEAEERYNKATEDISEIIDALKDMKWR